jgi:hypothetical protein
MMATLVVVVAHFLYRCTSSAVEDFFIEIRTAQWTRIYSGSRRIFLFFCGGAVSSRIYCGDLGLGTYENDLELPEDLSEDVSKAQRQRIQVINFVL